jgi:hypothetical protein
MLLRYSLDMGKDADRIERRCRAFWSRPSDSGHRRRRSRRTLGTKAMADLIVKEVEGQY